MPASVPAISDELWDFYNEMACGRQMTLNGDFIPIPHYYKGQFTDGYDAFFDNLPFKNPYDENDPRYVFWRAGWTLAFNETYHPKRIFRDGTRTIQNLGT